MNKICFIAHKHNIMVSCGKIIIINSPKFCVNANATRKVDPFIWQSGGRSRQKSTIKAGSGSTV